MKHAPDMESPRPPRRRRRTSEPRRLLLAIGLTLAFHVLVVGGVVLLSFLPSSRPPVTPRTAVAMQTLSAEDWERNRAVAPGDTAQVPPDRALAPPPEPEKEALKPAPEPPDPERPAGPVVATPPGNDEIPDDAAFAAETNNRVDRQTLARDRTHKWKNAQSRTTAEEDRQGQGTDAMAGTPSLEGNGGEGDDDRVRQEAGNTAPQMELPASAPRQEIAIRPPTAGGREEGPQLENQRSSEGFEGNSDRLNVTPGSEGSGDDGQLPSEGRRGQRGLASLMPSSAVMDRITGSAAADVRDENIEEGDGTFLNTRQWKYASFFNRVKQSVGFAWEPMHQLMRRDPTGSVYGGRDRVTVLAVKLDTTGSLQAVEIERSSGLDFLDLEAVRAFEKAQPFPRPPPGMVKDGVIAFNFTFYMDMGGTPRFRFSNPR